MNKLLVAAAVSLLVIQFVMAESAIAGAYVGTKSKFDEKAPIPRKGVKKKIPSQENTKKTTVEKQRLDCAGKLKGRNQLEGGGVRCHNAG